MLLLELVQWILISSDEKSGVESKDHLKSKESRIRTVVEYCRKKNSASEFVEVREG